MIGLALPLPPPVSVVALPGKPYAAALSIDVITSVVDNYAALALAAIVIF